MNKNEFSNEQLTIEFLHNEQGNIIKKIVNGTLNI